MRTGKGPKQKPVFPGRTSASLNFLLVVIKQHDQQQKSLSSGSRGPESIGEGKVEWQEEGAGPLQSHRPTGTREREQEVG